MADELKKALGGLRALAGDHRSGAAEIAERAYALLEEFCRQERPDDPRLPYALAELAETTLTAQPSMAPLLNLANLIQLAAERNARPLASLRAAIERLRRQRRQARAHIAALFAARTRRCRTVLTYSYSSTVFAALTARGKSSPLECVIVLESRPLYEGRLLAERLAAADVPVTLTIDAALAEQVEAADAVVVGADAVLEAAYVNKVGTRLLQEEARRAGKPFFLLADSAKFLAPALAHFHQIEEKPAHEVWREAPARVSVLNRYFERVAFAPHVKLLTERGLVTSARLPGSLKRLPVARRWKEAVPGASP